MSNIQAPFVPNIPIQRASIHDKYGGSRQGGISPCANFPYIFIFKGSAGVQHGYLDNWDNENVFSYTGEGQKGDMKFIKGNLALREHVNRGKRVFLFEYLRKGYVQFICELEGFDYDYFETPDTTGQNRLGIRFFFKRKGIELPETVKNYTGIQLLEEPQPSVYIDSPNITERIGLVTSRVGQGAYRKRIIHRWEYECAVTGFTKPEILIASHIVPWKDANNHERHDVHNGILLSPVYDALFDRHLISFENSGKIILSEKIESDAYNQIGIDGKEIIRKFNSDNFLYLERHRTVFVNI